MRTYSRKQTALYCAATAVLTAASISAYQLTRHEPSPNEHPAPSPQRPAVIRPVVSHLSPTPVDLRDPAGRVEVRKRYEEIIARRGGLVPPRARRALIQQFWALNLWKGMYWLGIPVLKSPSDMWMMQQVIAEVRPDFIIEAGTFYGGSALYFAHVLAGLGLSDARVITIDIHDKTTEASRISFWQQHVEFVHGSSTDPAVVSRIAERVKDGKVLVVLDSDHTRSHVLSELEAYAPLVSPGSYIVVEDTSLDGVPLADLGPGPMAAVEEFLGTGAGESFKPDVTREIFLVTFHPGGWLRRVR